MAHPSRERFIPGLLERLPGARVVWDERDDEWHTGRRALLAHIDSDADVALTVQDDAIVSRDLAGAVGGLMTIAGDRPVGLYVGNLDDGGVPFPELARIADEDGLPWLETHGPHWGVAFAIPAGHVRELVEWCDQLDGRNYDARIAQFYRARRVDCWYTWPSLVDHRCGAENPSLLGPKSDRHAARFIGMERSGLEIDWSRPPARATGDATARFRDSRGRIEAVPLNGDRYRRMLDDSAWEVVV